MSTAARRSSLRLTRWLLLVMLAVGVVGMHALGHSDVGHGYRDGAVSMGHMAADEQQAEIGMATDVSSVRHKLPDLDPAATCLAVLRSLLVLLLVAVCLRSQRWDESAARTAAWARRVLRPPPRQAALDLIRIAVLRI